MTSRTKAEALLRKIPSSWSNRDVGDTLEHYVLVDLAEGTPEFDLVLQRFSPTMPSGRIRKVLRENKVVPTTQAPARSQSFVYSQETFSTRTQICGNWTFFQFVG